MTAKSRALSLLILAEIAGMSLWFVSAAILPGMTAEADLSAGRQALLSSGVQAGFVVGALAFAILGLPDRLDPRRLFAACGVLAAALNGGLLIVPVGGDLAVAIRVATGLLLAGVYPVGMKIAVGWGTGDRGFLVSLLVGALTLGSAAPHLIALVGGADWRTTVTLSSLLAGAGAVLILGAGLGPHHARAPRLDPGALRLAWTDRRIRGAYAGYLGHMWELYAFWAWVGAMAAASYGATLPAEAADRWGTATAFAAIAIGAPACVLAGRWADRIGKAQIAIWAMGLSGAAAAANALAFGGPVWLTFALMTIWGLAVIPDSAQFSTLVADAAPAASAGSLLTLQTALGFALTAVTVQATPMLADAIGWDGVMAVLALGPAAGIAAMWRLRR